jgi:hypothetical protein
MRRFAPHVPTRTQSVRFVSGLATAVVLAIVSLSAQLPGRNVNMVSGVGLPNGDPFLQRQNEPSIAASTRNPLHLLGGSNDYRTIDIPGLCTRDPITDECIEPETGDAWLGLYKSSDGGQRWISTLLPGYPQDLTPEGLASPLKAYGAGADPVVRAGTNGLFYYAGLVFDRTENGKSAIFMARFMDLNNREDGDATAYLGTSLVATATGTTDERFLDKPWLGVDIPRGGPGPLCHIEAPGMRRKNGTGQMIEGPAVLQDVPAGALYVVYTAFYGPADDRHSEILLARSFDCGKSWQAPVRVSRAEDPINQGATLAIDPKTGDVYVAWRRFTKPNTTVVLDAVMVARLPRGASSFNPPAKARQFAQAKKAPAQPERFSGKKAGTTTTVVDELTEFDQGTGTFQFRTNAYPAMAIDHDSRIYLAWSERGYATFRSDPVTGDARIVMATSADGTTFTQPFAIDNAPSDPFTEAVGHQVMPSIAIAGGKMMVAYYDLRETKAAVLGSGAFGPQISDKIGNVVLAVRNTIDIRAAMATLAAAPNFAPSVKVSQYLVGHHPTLGPGQKQLQFNPPNLPMFKQGTVPFMGDYIDIAPAPSFIPTANGGWVYNTAATPALPVFHAVWTDNRDVRKPVDNDWTNYGPPNSAVPSLPCVPGNAGSRNQNIYTSRITGGLMVGSPGNTKPLSPTLQRAFVVFAQNQTATTRAFRMRIVNQPPGGRASFDQFPLPPYTAASPPPNVDVDFYVLRRSAAARTVYATSTDPHATITVEISEIDAPNGEEVDGGLHGLVLLNPDLENPELENPELENPELENPDLENAEVYNPDLENPDLENPELENPELENPDLENLTIETPDLENPDLENILIANPDLENPDLENPDLENPELENPELENTDIENVAVGGDGVLTDTTWNVTNIGNTTSAYNVNLFLNQAGVPGGFKTQLILHKTYRTPVVVPGGCTLAYHSTTVVSANVPSPSFILPTDGGVPDQNDPSEKNATLWLAPGEIGKITLRVYDADRSNNVFITNKFGKLISVDPAFHPITSVTPAISSQPVSTEALEGGLEEPPLVTPTGANLFFLQMPTDGIETVAIAPAVRVQVRDNLSGTPIPGALVTLALGNNPGGASLSGNIAVSNEFGIATFPLLAVSVPGEGLTLIASATAQGVVGSAESVAFDIGPVPPVEIALPSVGERTAYLGVSYALTLTATGGIAPLTWSVVDGDLPPGLSLNPATGVISGTATEAGPFTITVRAEDIGGRFDTQIMCITAIDPFDTDVVTTAVDGDNLTITEVVTSLLGQGVAISNVVLTGANAGAGVFTGGSGILGFENGIVLSSGSVNDASGPNDLDNTTTIRGEPGDADLEALSGQPTNDATVVEFDFIPSGNQVSFRYVFGSEEYNEFVASQYNDSFGFFITGPDNIQRNWALVPGTDQAVTINTINNGVPFGVGEPSNPQFYRNNDPNDPGATINIEADGLTVVLTFTAPVVAGQSHHMKLAIADAGDSSLDSWVFIQSGSFHAVENCNNGVDDDGDELIDGADPDCAVCPPVIVAEPIVIGVPGTAGGTANSNNENSGGTDPVVAYQLSSNQSVTVTASGLVTYFVEGDFSQEAGPNGADFSADEFALAPGLQAIALLARIGGGEWQLVGAGPTVLEAGPDGGLLEFAVNDRTYFDNAGSFTVTIQP